MDVQDTIQMVNYWNAEWGMFKIPDDVPIRFRKDGWFDHRLSMTPQLEKYFSDMNERLRDDLPIKSWAEWKGKQ
jgi:hypothetical protein